VLTLITQVIWSVHHSCLYVFRRLIDSATSSGNKRFTHVHTSYSFVLEAADFCGHGMNLFVSLLKLQILIFIQNRRRQYMSTSNETPRRRLKTNILAIHDILRFHLQEFQRSDHHPFAAVTKLTIEREVTVHTPKYFKHAPNNTKTRNMAIYVATIEYCFVFDFK
jgi:hypothetical protein